MKTFGEYIKNVRLSKKLTMATVTERMGKTGNQCLVNWESGKIKPRLEGLKLLAKALEEPLLSLQIASGTISKKLLPGIRRNMAQVIKFLQKMQTV